MAVEGHPSHMSKALHDFLAAEDGDDDPAADAADDAGDGVALGELDISTGGGASLAGLEQQLDRLSDHPVLRAILDQVRQARDASSGLHPCCNPRGAAYPEHPHLGLRGDNAQWCIV